MELAVNMPAQEPQVGQGAGLDLGNLLGRGLGVAGRDQGVDGVDPLAAAPGDLAGLHRPAGHEDGRNVQPQRCVQHPRRVILSQLEMQTRASGQWALTMYSTQSAIQVARRQRIEHARVAHGDAVVHGDGIELAGHPAGLGDGARHQVAYVLQAHAARHELGERIGDRDDRLSEIAVAQATSPPQRPRARRAAAPRDRARGCRAPAKSPTPEAPAARAANDGLGLMRCCFP